MKKFSLKWKSSKNPRKQRKYLANAPLHTRKAFLRVQLSKPLRQKYKRRNALVRTGDKVKIMRGQFRKLTGKVESVDYKATRIYIDVASFTKKDGSKSSYPMHPSNLQIQELQLDDKKRLQSIQRTMVVKK
ncbi:MAG TPA: 50S ribosomal protein L24 [Candidatus Nanoarchaeia archaeon]|nr:50S ribosomal protein L24 [Candidatus Nanoarchaeia archaeon]